MLLVFLCRLGHFWQTRKGSGGGGEVVRRKDERLVKREAREKKKKKKKRGKWVSGLKGGTATAIGDMQPGEGGRKERRKEANGKMAAAAVGGEGLSKLRRKGSRRV